MLSITKISSAFLIVSLLSLKQTPVLASGKIGKLTSAVLTRQLNSQPDLSVQSRHDLLVEVPVGSDYSLTKQSDFLVLYYSPAERIFDRIVIL